MTRESHLHAITDAEADVLGLRVEAMQRFRARYTFSAESQRAMVGGLRRLARSFSAGRYDERTFPWEILVDQDMAGEMWRTVASRYGRATALKDASALRVLLRYYRDVRLLTHDQYADAISFETRGRSAASKPGRYLTPDDISNLVVACGNNTSLTTRVRDVALLLTLASTAARRSELAAVRLDETHLDQQRLWLTHTKNGQPRDAWLAPATVAALQQWIDIRGHAGDYLLAPLSRTGRPLTDRPISGHQIWKVVRRRADEAGLDGVTPHDFRRFVISQLLPTTDIALVSRIVGHSNPNTTAKYDRRPAEMCREAIATLQLPDWESIAGVA